MLALSVALKIVSSVEPCMLASEDHASHDARTTEANKIFKLMRAFPAASYNSSMCLCCKWNTRRRPHQDFRLELKAILGKTRTTISAPSSVRFPVYGQDPRRHLQHYATKSVHLIVTLALLERSGHLDTPPFSTGPRFFCRSGEELGGSMNVCLAWITQRRLHQDSSKRLEQNSLRHPQRGRKNSTSILFAASQAHENGTRGRKKARSYFHREVSASTARPPSSFGPHAPCPCTHECDAPAARDCIDT